MGGLEREGWLWLMKDWEGSNRVGSNVVSWWGLDSEVTSPCCPINQQVESKRFEWKSGASSKKCTSPYTIFIARNLTPPKVNPEYKLKTNSSIKITILTDHQGSLEKSPTNRYFKFNPIPTP